MILDVAYRRQHPFSTAWQNDLIAGIFSKLMSDIRESIKERLTKEKLILFSLPVGLFEVQI